jgi:hypothetical protein
MLIKKYTFLGLFLFLPFTQQTYANYKITTEALRGHVNFLTSDALEGRLTGSAGEKLATHYVAQIFAGLGLEPAGDNGTFFQEFTFTSGVALGANNSLTIRNHSEKPKKLTLNKDWRPLSFSDSRAFAITKPIFAGYGISAPALGKLAAYDSYAHLNVKDQWVIVLNDLPKKISIEQKHQLSPYATPRYKAFTAKALGAKGIIFVGSPLIPLSSDASFSGSGIIALSLSNDIFAKQQLQHNHLEIYGQTQINKSIQRGRNVLALLKISPEAIGTLVLGAHIDHLGRGQLSGSRAHAEEAGMIHAGADDNASGVASILETAARLTMLKRQDKLQGNKNILFAAWSGEEFGILGSSHFVAHSLKQPPINATINLDMVGHLRERLVVQGLGSSPDWPALLKSINTHGTFSLIQQQDPYLPTDATSFYLQGIPILNLFTGAHDNYHTPRDTANTLNYVGMKNICDFLVSLTLALEARPKPLNFQKMAKPQNNTEKELKVYLGTIPDYAQTNHEGVKLSGVAKNSPAELAGVQKNDVVIELAGNTIHDIYDYTFVLNQLPVDKVVPLLVLREQKPVRLTIRARYRE